MTFPQDDDIHHQHKRKVDFTHDTISKVVKSIIRPNIAGIGKVKESKRVREIVYENNQRRLTPYPLMKLDWRVLICIIIWGSELSKFEKVGFGLHDFSEMDETLNWHTFGMLLYQLVYVISPINSTYRKGYIYVFCIHCLQKVCSCIMKANCTWQFIVVVTKHIEWGKLNIL